MYIKQIIIQGFKSYKDQTVIEPFSPGTNVIVGRNGAGKSNFFAAIRFVLSDAYTQLSREERQALLHEGSGSAVMSAYVEVIFDNSDERFPTTSKEVVLRRTIALKKDEYSVDRRVTPKSEVMNMLEHAGFSRSNPYYIVPQGRVTALTNMKESDRLNLLKEVAGTHVYESRRAESGKIIVETSNKRQKIDELLTDVKERLNELEGEKEELRAFQTKDRERKCLEYAYYQRHQGAIQDKLDDIESYRQGGMETTESNRAEFVESEKTIADFDAKIHQTKREMELLAIDHRQLDEDRRENVKTRAQAEMKVKALSDGQSARDQAATQSAAELESVRTEMAAKKAELVKIEPEYNKRKLKEDGIKRSLDSVDADRCRLLMKQSHGQQFKSKQERDVRLREQVNEAMMHSSAQKANLLDAQEDVKTRQAKVKQAESDVVALRARMEGWAGERLRLGDEATKAQDFHSKLLEERKSLRREEEKLDNILKDARREMETAERAFYHTMDNQASNGLKTIRRLQNEKDIPGAYGTLAELLKVDEKYRLPVEQTAGASLYHYVVDNADTATYLLQELNKQRGGRVTFMPLKELRGRSTKLPRAADAIPLIEKVEFDEKYQKAFQQVFGKTIVCPSLQVATAYTKSHGVDAITLDGDTANKRGALTGGYIDPKKSRLVALSAAVKWREEYSVLERQASAIRGQIEKKEQEIAQARGEEVRLEQKLNQENNSFASLNQDLKIKSDYLARERGQLENTHKRLEDIEGSLQELDQAVASNEALLASDFKQALTAAEEKQLEELEKRVELLHKQWNDACNRRRELERRKKLLNHELNQNLQLRLDQLNVEAAEDSASAPSGSVKEANRELKRIQKVTVEVESRLKEVDARLDKLQERVERLEADKTAEETKQQEIAGRIERQRKKVEKNLQRKAALMLEQAECSKTIRDLGVLPEEAFEKYENMEPKTLLNKLQKIKSALAKYKHVNKKAFEQYNSFTTQQGDLLKRRRDLDSSQAAIQDLIEHLDRRKDEAIERTFKQVSKEFATIFERLVPAGHGRLVIQRRADRRQEQEDSEDDNRGTIENYTGVGISVSFNSKTMDEQQKIQQLSGGQKSLCALCLIFALQQTESSPMVIFDEVDANLDAQYRTAVAALLESISDEAGTQFICTTFRPEIVHIADKCYGVTFHNKASSIDCVSTEDALNFVEGQARPQ